MQTESTQDCTGMTTQQESDALDAAWEDELAEGPITRLVECYGLGQRVKRVLEEIGCQTGPELLKLNTNRLFLSYGVLTVSKIRLLRDWLVERKRRKKCEATGPTQGK